jgi:hypothetical protein
VSRESRQSSHLEKLPRYHGIRERLVVVSLVISIKREKTQNTQFEDCSGIGLGGNIVEKTIQYGLLTGCYDVEVDRSTLAAAYRCHGSPASPL